MLSARTRARGLVFGLIGGGALPVGLGLGGDVVHDPLQGGLALDVGRGQAALRPLPASAQLPGLDEQRAEPVEAVGDGHPQRGGEQLPQGLLLGATLLDLGQAQGDDAMTWAACRYRPAGPHSAGLLAVLRGGHPFPVGFVGGAGAMG
ncbi:hypothetical protein ACTG9Q_24745 [Actinokineospora sp. 24-640]